MRDKFCASRHRRVIAMRIAWNGMAWHGSIATIFASFALVRLLLHIYGSTHSIMRIVRIAYAFIGYTSRRNLENRLSQGMSEN